MRFLSCVALVLGLFTGGGSPAQDAASEALVGTWDDVTPERENAGKQHIRPKTFLTITGTAFTAQELGGPVFRQSLFVLPARDPNHLIDFITVDGGVFYKTHALYKIEGDTLTIKEGALERPRPVDLSPDEFGGGAKDWAPVYVYKRRPK